MLKEVDSGIAHAPARGIKVVELSSASTDLQSVDDGKATVIADDEYHLVTAQHGAVDIRVAHEVRAISHERQDFTALGPRAFGQGHARTPCSGNLVTHRRKSPLGIEGVRGKGIPCHRELTEDATGGTHHVILRLGQRIACLNHLAV